MRSSRALRSPCSGCSRPPKPSKRGGRPTQSRRNVVEKSGEQCTVDMINPKGHNENPMNNADVDAKFTSTAEPVLGVQQAAKALETWWKTDSEPSKRGGEIRRAVYGRHDQPEGPQRESDEQRGRRCEVHEHCGARARGAAGRQSPRNVVEDRLRAVETWWRNPASSVRST